jgi:antitoxin HicB
LALDYPLNVIADPDGGYVVEFPDLPGCMTQVETLAELSPMAEEVRRLWLETTYEQGLEIPLPSYPEEYSGTLSLRVPRSLHRALAEAAKREGVSVDQYVLTLLSRADSEARVERRLADLEAALKAIRAPVPAD